MALFLNCILVISLVTAFDDFYSTSRTFRKRNSQSFFVAAIDVYTNDFVVRLEPNSITSDHAEDVAGRLGFENRGEIPSSEGLYHFKHQLLRASSSKPSLLHLLKLRLEPKVESAIQVTGYDRNKRGYKKKLKTHAYEGLDPLYPYQWYLNNTGQAGGIPGLDLNVQEAWDMGYTGKGITVAIMDDGIDYLHPDLRDNYNAQASYDFSSNDPYPYPRYTVNWFNSHGTRCAGEVVGKADNGICGVGVAYDAKVAGIRMLDQPYMTDLIEAKSMSYKPNVIDIYSASWGPTDDGKTVDGPRRLTLKAMADGVNKGRNGLGSIYVWASGDGGAYDDCNCDGYAASMWTISVNSAVNNGKTAIYDESCSSTLASTFSNSGNRNPGSGVATTDLYGNCTLHHSGTSAAAPEAAGVFALALEANPKLTWRDMQHLTVLTSTRNKLYDRLHKWKRNGVGLEFNHLFGFGVLNAGRMVKMASEWKTVPTRYRCEAGETNQPYIIPSDGVLEILMSTDACDQRYNHVKYLEHVQAFITLDSSRRGDVTINLTSPMDTESILLSKRPRDDDFVRGFQRWPFMTTHTWGEDPRGTWRLRIAFNSQFPREGVLREWKLLIHGTQTAPYIDEVVNNQKSRLSISKKLEMEEGAVHDLVDQLSEAANGGSL